MSRVVQYVKQTKGWKYSLPIRDIEKAIIANARATYYMHVFIVSFNRNCNAR